jgi:hypothetical protein
MRKFVNLTAAVSMLALSIGITTDRAFAFAETTDRTEAYTILPNQSAFWVPDVGANQKSQAKFESEEYYNDNKIAAKRFVIPHAKLSGSGGYGWTSGWDLIVPTGRLYIVDRTPYSREWVDATDRGTSAKKEGFPCQSKEGLNVTVGVSIGANVSEDNAAKFLYNFGVISPKGIPTDPQVIFASVYYGRSLQEVMDDVGRKKVQTLVCNEISSRTFDAVNSDAVVEMATIEKKTKEYFDSVGITLGFIGWADTFAFDKDVQDAVNTKYIAEHLSPVLPIMQAIAQIKVQEGLSSGLDKHGLPMVISPDTIKTILGLVPPMLQNILPATPAMQK